MLEAQAAYHEAGLDFGRHAVAITGEGSQLDKVAQHERWLERFPMFDWIGGRTSELSAVGLLPAALQGFDVECDVKRRRADGRFDAAPRDDEKSRRVDGGDVASGDERAGRKRHGDSAV